MAEGTGKLNPRILFVSAADWAFRAHRLSLAKWLVAKGATVGVICPPGDAVAELEAAGLVVFPMKLSRDKISASETLAAAKAVREGVQAFRTDVLHCVSLRCVLFGWLAMRGVRDRPRVVNHVIGMGSLYSDEARSMKLRLLRGGVDWCLRRAFRAPDATTVFQNHDDLNWWRDHAALTENQLACLPGSIDTALAKASTDADGPPWRMIFVGRLLKDKGVAELMEAHAVLRARGMAVELALCGDVDAGNPKSFTCTEAEEFGSAEGCKWLGRRDDVLEQIAASHMLVLPTYREGLPRVLLEAGLTRRAVVATDVPGCREVVVDGESGVLCAPRDAMALAEAIQRVFEDEDLRGRLAEGLRERVEEKFADSVVNPRWWNLYVEGRP
ncbi:glycosyltransferase family 4 protein [Verrucomicrobia bacterium]|nr:glycosyltransferase family 4 protein [Verrucomicrobiota bacterium]MDC0218445.1 glycosyltransferase family 4 protein [Verrucomicrobiota bacterium]